MEFFRFVPSTLIAITLLSTMALAMPSQFTILSRLSIYYLHKIGLEKQQNYNIHFFMLLLSGRQFKHLKKTSLLRRLQAQTLPDATPPIGKIYPFTKMAVTFEPLMQF